jgi:hypothetical protein
MVWVLDLDDPKPSSTAHNSLLNIHSLLGDNTSDNIDSAHKKQDSLTCASAANSGMFWTICQADPHCPTGFTRLTLGHGKVSRHVLSVTAYHQSGKRRNKAA